MPFKIRKLRNKELYQVKNIKTGEIHSKHTSLANAKKQLDILQRIEFEERVLKNNPDVKVRHF